MFVYETAVAYAPGIGVGRGYHGGKSRSGWGYDFSHKYIKSINPLPIGEGTKNRGL